MRLMIAWSLLALVATGPVAVVGQESSGAGRGAGAVLQALGLNPLTGTYREVGGGSDGEIGRTVLAATANLDSAERERQAPALIRVLHASQLFAIEQYGTTVVLNQPPARRVPYDADGRVRTLRVAGGEVVTTRARVEGRRLTIDLTWSGGERLRLEFERHPSEASLTFTRTAAGRGLPRPVSVVSRYELVSPRATRNFKGL